MARGRASAQGLARLTIARIARGATRGGRSDGPPEAAGTAAGAIAARLDAFATSRRFRPPMRAWRGACGIA
ncbi:hypothetical protein C7S16_0492 [Burkholderia thailandensis]|uniref:Uncharacterized protein n=1 Tax=Burkholderia thailandensis TaxID=57975 RepID=A0AAW9CUB8_BURTH|nr:hypothetical protein [Burkholderia thailandensis]MDW9254250.1 hypothetical protein [Burkholderia thailandensis]